MDSKGILFLCLQVPRLSGAGGIGSQLQAAQHQQRSSQVQRPQTRVSACVPQTGGCYRLGPKRRAAGDAMFLIRSDL